MSWYDEFIQAMSTGWDYFTNLLDKSIAYTIGGDFTSLVIPATNIINTVSETASSIPAFLSGVGTTFLFAIGLFIYLSIK